MGTVSKSSEIYVFCFRFSLILGQFERVVGYEECDCGVGYRKKIVLDVFGGRGTVGKVAKKLGMNYLLFDIDLENVKIAKKYINRSELPNYRKLERRRNTITSPDYSSCNLTLFDF